MRVQIPIDPPFKMPYKDKKAQSAYQCGRVKKLKEIWLKENGPCKTCGSTENLQVDHLDSSRKTSHRIWSWSETRRIEELAKCQVLCKSCHIIKSHDEYNIGEDHFSAKLTEEQVLEIRRRASNGEKQKNLCIRYNVHKSTMSDIVLRKKWKHI